jgi:hypothetical protein
MELGGTIEGLHIGYSVFQTLDIEGGCRARDLYTIFKSFIFFTEDKRVWSNKFTISA